MKSFQVYLPGGRTPTAAGWCVIVIAIAAMILGIARIWSYDGSLSQKDLMRMKVFLVFGGIAIISVGYVLLKLIGLPFSKIPDEKKN